MTNTWLNKDSLYVKFGTAQADKNNAGEYRFDGARHLTEIKLDLTKVTATDGSYIVSDTVFMPKNAKIEQVDIFTETAATGSGAVLNLGLIKTDRATEVDFNGLLAAFPKTSCDSLGETTQIRFGDTYAGALIGTVTSATYPTYLVADYDTAAFTAGVIIIRIYWHYVA